MKAARDPDDGYAGPRSPARVMAVVEALAEHPEGLSLTRLSIVVGMPKTSLLSMLRVLEVSGHVRAEHNLYTLGPLAYRIGVMIAASFPLVRALRPLMADYARRAGETILLAALDRTRDESTYVEIAQPDVPVRFFASVGARRALYCTASGRAMLAFQEPAYIADYIARIDPVAMTPTTVTDKAAIAAQAREDRARGYAASIGGYDLSSGGVAAPIFDREGKVGHAVVIAAPVERMRERQAELAALALEMSAAFSKVLGYSGTPT